MAAVGSFFLTPAAADPCTQRPAQPVPDKLKRLQSRAMWAGWTLLEVVPGGFAFVNFLNEAERYPNSGWIGEAEVEQFLSARERERSRW